MRESMEKLVKPERVNVARVGCTDLKKAVIALSGPGSSDAIRFVLRLLTC